MKPSAPVGPSHDLLRDALRCEEQGDLDRAARLLADAAPDDAASAAAAARIAGKRRDGPTLVASLRRLVALEPKRGAHRHDLATALFTAGDLAGAEAAARALLALEPRAGRTLNLLGVIQKRQGRL